MTHAQALIETTALRYLDPQRLRFAHHGARLRLVIEGECCYRQVTIYRAFPLSQPERYLSVRDGDGGEVGIVVDAALLDAESRRALELELERRYMAPVISRVLRVKERFGTVEWLVETDRGICAFTTRNLREHNVQPAPGRYLLSDVDGNRYDLPDITALDGASQAWIIRHT
jgi:hypothetical protein